jgi:hypothetical protein
VFIWVKRRLKYKLQGADRNTACYDAIYGWLLIISTTLIIQSIILSSYGYQTAKIIGLYPGVAMLIPFVFFIFLGDNKSLLRFLIRNFVF